MKTITIDVKNKSLGRAASEIAAVLQGKHKTAYEPRQVGGDKVVVKNVSQLKFTGKKFDNKVYYRHTGYMGHLKSKTLKQAWTKDPAWVLRKAVRGMLPKNSLLKKRLRLLEIENG